MEKRADALDALRGFAIITMILSGSIPFSGPASLPGWMYHAQLPPPDHIFNPKLPGITWVDLVFPFFLFSMGAAFPFALRRRLAAGSSLWKLMLQSLQRGFLLVLFALLLQHTKPFALSATPGWPQWSIGLAGFGLLFILFFRYPKTWRGPWILAAKAITLVAAWLLISQLDYAKGHGFQIGRSDIIIIVLANVALFGSVIWLLTRENLAGWLSSAFSWPFASPMASRAAGPPGCGTLRRCRRFIRFISCSISSSSCPAPSPAISTIAGCNPRKQRRVRRRKASWAPCCCSVWH